MSSGSRQLFSPVIVILGTAGLLLFASEALGASPGVCLTITIAAGIAWFGGAAVSSRTAGGRYSTRLTNWGIRGWTWWLIPGAWWTLWSVLPLPEDHPCFTLLSGSSELWFSVALAGWDRHRVVDVRPV